MEFRLKFKKGEPIKFISHLDLIRVFDRAIRRANLPIAYSKGFNPRPKMTFGPALKVGITSTGEYLDLEFTKPISESKIRSRLNDVMPKGLIIEEVERLYEDNIKLSHLNVAIYSITIKIDGISRTELEDSISKILQAKEIIRFKPYFGKKKRRKPRKVNIATLIYDIKLLEWEQPFAKLYLELSVGQKGSLSPETVITELENILKKDIDIVKIHREDLYLKNGNLTLFPLQKLKTGEI